MTIESGQSPETGRGSNLNKFVDAKNGEGHRGKVLAVSPDGKRAIMHALTQGFTADGVQYGQDYWVDEVNPNEWPVVDRPHAASEGIPKDWTLNPEMF
jgi:hypothetical protein